MNLYRFVGNEEDFKKPTAAHKKNSHYNVGVRELLDLQVALALIEQSMTIAAAITAVAHAFFIPFFHVIRLVITMWLHVLVHRCTKIISHTIDRILIQLNSDDGKLLTQRALHQAGIDKIGFWHSSSAAGASVRKWICMPTWIVT